VKETTNQNDISRSLLTMVIINSLIYSKQVAELQKIKHVIWIGPHIDLELYMQMSQDTFFSL